MSIQDLKNTLGKDLFGLTPAEAREKGLCIKCQQPPRFYSEAGRKEYQISSLCEYCFDDITWDGTPKELKKHQEDVAKFENS